MNQEIAKLFPRTKKIVLFILINAVFINFLVSKNIDPIVQIGDVKIIGTYDRDHDIESFLGVPFAMPPTGELRWEEPKSYKFQKKLFKAKEFKPACMQGPRIVNWYKRLITHFDGDEDIFSTPSFSEDCLYLNIWRPKSASKNSLLPVIVYIHGGSNKAGWSYEPNYHGHNYAKRDVILVSIPYRLGIFGFFIHENINEKNLALLDIISSLNWINKNIRFFGGNPNNVTLMGESSGANNINFLLASPLTKGLFNKVIHQSGGSSISYPSKKSIEVDLGKKFVDHVTNGKEYNDIKRYLKGISPLELLQSANKIYANHYFDPIVDNEVVFRSLHDSINNGDIHSVDLMIGSNNDEWSLYFEGIADVDAWFKEETTNKQSNQLKSILKNIKNPIRKLDLLITAKNYVCPSLKLAHEIKKKNKNAWVYSFDRVRPGIKANEFGAYHGAELPYVFDNHDEWLPINKIDKELTEIMISYWLDFSKFGNPNSFGKPDWKIFTLNHQETQILGDDVYNISHPSKKICEVLLPLNPKVMNL